jgi:lysozyme family protein
VHKSLIVTVVLLGILVLLAGVYLFAEEPITIVDVLEKGEPLNQEESVMLAEHILKSSPMYSFDGMDLDLLSTKTLRCPSCWAHTFYFKCSFAGYGDVDDRGELVSYGTIHTARIILRDKNVESFLVDNTWDELRKEFI